MFDRFPISLHMSSSSKWCHVVSSFHGPLINTPKPVQPAQNNTLLKKMGTLLPRQAWPSLTNTPPSLIASLDAKTAALEAGNRFPLQLAKLSGAPMAIWNMVQRRMDPFGNSWMSMARRMVHLRNP